MTAPWIDHLMSLANKPVANSYAFADPVGQIVTVPRPLQGDAAITSGELNLAYFQAPADALPITHIALATQGTIVATPTLIRYGLYEVSDTRDLTLVASSANDTTMFAATYSESPKAFTAPMTLQPHGIYAAAVLVVAGTAGSYNGQFILDFVGAMEPRITGRLENQTDLPATIAHDAVETNWRLFSFRLF